MNIEDITKMIIKIKEFWSSAITNYSGFEFTLYGRFFGSEFYKYFKIHPKTYKNFVKTYFHLIFRKAEKQTKQTIYFLRKHTYL